MNKNSSPSLSGISQEIADLMPNVVRGVQMDFFATRPVTQTQFFLMVAIHSYGRCMMTALARSLKIQLPTATGLVERLAKAGYVERVRAEEDRRRVLIALTPKGQKLVADFRGAMRRRWEEVTAVLDARERREFYSLIRKLKGQFEEKAP